uniref:DUF2470 domain-containing protein n=1 Tax=Pyramimonas obovata TaxID=1411642 RepID=A0A7S0R7X6_9CHLO|eukprot:CAMPEP_0118924684 /NCGR_PEP_ID=MMETSP1169-20130426/2701_1 /TAXON_ID=36882 /ORGANISM="Pyramimonas obovata, Strain CCMP722" /LENGTH=344 /DNA_ID=CAMNT_0006865815 /DNA_START=52 /DNA_END=1086 /DNA_ORIENTATION=+
MSAICEAVCTTRSTRIASASVRSPAARAVALKSCPAQAPSSSSSACVRKTTSFAAPALRVARNKTRHARTLAAAAVEAPAAADATVRTDAEVVRTVLEVSTGGTLSTISADEDKWPIGTYVRYVLDAEGLPVFKLRPGAVHTENLAVDNRCSLYVRPHGITKTMSARATLVGKVAPVDQSSDEGKALVQAYMDRFNVCEEEVEFVRLEVDKVLYVANMCDQALPVSAEDYKAADADPLCLVAPSIMEFWNANCQDELLRTSASMSSIPEADLAAANLLWVDQFGCDAELLLSSGQRETLRIPFARAVRDERAARSALTMMGQVAWEEEKDYRPVPIPLEEEPEK